MNRAGARKTTAQFYGEVFNTINRRLEDLEQASNNAIKTATECYEERDQIKKDYDKIKAAVEQLYAERKIEYYGK